MNRSTKILFILCGLMLAAGIFISVSSAQINPIWTVILPIGAVLYGICLILRIFQSESAKFDEEERARRELHRRNQPNSTTETEDITHGHGHQHAGVH